MPKSKIIKEFINNKIELSQALERVLVIAIELNDAETISWVKNEKNGYNANDVVPSYRIIPVTPIGDFNVVSMGVQTTYTNRTLPTIGVPENTKKMFNQYSYKSSISEICSQIDLFKKTNQSISIPISPEYFFMFAEGTNADIISAGLNISPFNLERIIEAVRMRTIELLVLLEKNFGILDDLDINVNEYKENELIKMKEACNMIIDGNYKGDINIISESKIKKSNIGNTNSFNKETHTEINPETKINFANKKSFLEKIIKFFRGRNNG